MQETPRRTNIDPSFQTSEHPFPHRSISIGVHPSPARIVMISLPCTIWSPDPISTPSASDASQFHHRHRQAQVQVRVARSHSPPGTPHPIPPVKLVIRTPVFRTLFSTSLGCALKGLAVDIWFGFQSSAFHLTNRTISQARDRVGPARSQDRSVDVSEQD